MQPGIFIPVNTIFSISESHLVASLPSMMFVSRTSYFQDDYLVFITAIFHIGPKGPGGPLGHLI